MVNIIQTTSSVMGDKEVDFQSRSFKYESLSELIYDFECNNYVWLGAMYSSTMYGALIPNKTIIEECVIKSHHHVMYRVSNSHGMQCLVRFYVV